MAIQKYQLQARQGRAPQEREEEGFGEWLGKMTLTQLMGGAVGVGTNVATEHALDNLKTQRSINVETARSNLVAGREKAASDRMEQAEIRREGRKGVRDVMSKLKTQQIGRLNAVAKIKELQSSLSGKTLSQGGNVAYGDSVSAILGSYADNEQAAFEYDHKIWLDEKEEARANYLKEHPGQTATAPVFKKREPKREDYNFDARAQNAIRNLETTIRSKGWQNQRINDPEKAADILHELSNNILTAVAQDSADERARNFELLRLNAEQAGWNFNPEVAQYKFDEHHVDTLAKLQGIYEKNFYREKYGENWQARYARRDAEFDPGAIFPAFRNMGPKGKRMLQNFSYLFSPHQRRALNLTDEHGPVLDTYTTILRGKDEKQTFVPGYGPSSGGLVSAVQNLTMPDKKERELHRLLGNWDSEPPVDTSGDLQEPEAAFGSATRQRPSERHQEKSLSDLHPLSGNMERLEVRGEPSSLEGGRRLPEQEIPAPRQASRTSKDVWVEWYKGLSPAERKSSRVLGLLPSSVRREVLPGVPDGYDPENLDESW